MKNPDLVVDQIRSRYNGTWRDWLLHEESNTVSFPLASPTAQTIAREPDTVSTWMRAWRNWAQAHPVAQLRTVTRHTILGTQEIFTHLQFATIDDLAIIGQPFAGHWTRVKARWARMRELPAGVDADRVRPYLPQIANLEDEDFGVLLDAVNWFTENPQSGLTIRQVPVRGMHTKWLARHRRLVLACLNSPHLQAIPEQPDDQLSQHDLDPLGLRALPMNINVILADPSDRELICGLRHLNAPIHEISALPIQPKLVLIIENKESAYLIPDQPRTVIIHSLGNNLNVLGEIGWLGGADHLYWGDIDRAGLTLLSRARTRLPRLDSVLMDPVTFAQHQDLAVRDDTRSDPPESNLTGAETLTLSALSTDHGIHLRLEQERLPAPFVLAELTNATARYNRRQQSDTTATATGES